MRPRIRYSEELDALIHTEFMGKEGPTPEYSTSDYGVALLTVALNEMGYTPVIITPYMRPDDAAGFRASTVFGQEGAWIEYENTSIPLAMCGLALKTIGIDLDDIK